MPDDKTQNRGNHVRFHPLFHFVLAPLLILFLALALFQLFRAPGPLTVSLTVLAVILFLLALLARTYALKVQDRLIRLEEQLRMARLLSADLQERAAQLTVSQLVALRFASDSELSSLVQQTLTEGWNSRQIKDRIVVWRPDTHRV